MSNPRQRTIIKVIFSHLVARMDLIIKVQVFRKFSNSLGPDALQFLESILDEHDIADADVESSIELIAKEYNKEDGTIDLHLIPVFPLTRVKTRR